MQLAIVAGCASNSGPIALETARGRGRRLTAWANLLWDWRGKGDTYYAVLDQ